VERLYFPDEAHYFRFFVKKPQRRAPLINRGYWLRMKAVDHVVRRFLETSSKKQKVVVNLGCG
jgi:tRNA wybutosine-synthesizing protein 4